MKLVNKFYGRIKAIIDYFVKTQKDSDDNSPKDRSLGVQGIDMFY